MQNLRTLVGNTPLVKISEKIYAKLETYNPSGSVKDRMISYIIRRARMFGEIDKDTIMCEATSGNSGIALAMMAAQLGNKCIIFMPGNMSEERKQMMRIYGADVIDAPDNDFKAAIFLRDQFLQSNEKAWSPMQFSNKANIECHYFTTAPEIHKQIIPFNRTWEAFIHGAGTGGTIEGMRRYIQHHKLHTKTCLVMPDESPHGIQGIGDGGDFLAKPLDMDHIINIKTDDAIERAKRLASEKGLLVGISSGANVLAAEKWIEKYKPAGIVVTMLCDRGERYMSIY